MSPDGLGWYFAGQRPLRGLGIANPASEACVASGGQSLSLDGPGGAVGVCAFKDGTFCDEWKLYRGECRSGECTKPTGDCGISKSAAITAGVLIVALVGVMFYGTVKG